MREINPSPWKRLSGEEKGGADGYLLIYLKK
jgi:hypothetical protein